MIEKITLLLIILSIGHGVHSYGGAWMKKYRLNYRDSLLNIVTNTSDVFIISIKNDECHKCKFSEIARVGPSILVRMEHICYRFIQIILTQLNILVK